MKLYVIYCISLVLAIVLGTGCMARRARQGYVEAQYDYARSWAKKDKRNEAFYWMKESANGVYPKAMWDISLYYLNGYGTDVNVKEAIKWMHKYVIINPKKTREALEICIKHFPETEREQSSQFLEFLRQLLIIEHGQHFTSKIQIAIAKEIHNEMKQISEYWLAQNNFRKAQETVKFCMDIAMSYDNTFDNSFYEDANVIMSKSNDMLLKNK